MDKPQDGSYHTALRCRNCMAIIMSLSRHDLVSCSCFKNELDTTGVFIDGGKDYVRVGGNLENAIYLYIKVK